MLSYASGIDVWLFALICGMKYSQWVGIAAALLLIAACFLPWAWYPDLNQYFTGFHSELNVYGRPGKVLAFFAMVAIAFYLIPRIWAKRSNMLVAAFALAFAIRCYIVFTACYRGICPEKHAGIFLIVGAALVMLLASFLPDLNSPNRAE
jgi:peptidoglycan/LPS O-acetylase OafA/YrhL